MCTEHNPVFHSIRGQPASQQLLGYQTTAANPKSHFINTQNNNPPILYILTSILLCYIANIISELGMVYLLAYIHSVYLYLHNIEYMMCVLYNVHSRRLSIAVCTWQEYVREGEEMLCSVGTFYIPSPHSVHVYNYRYKLKTTSESLRKYAQILWPRGNRLVNVVLSTELILH